MTINKLKYVTNFTSFIFASIAILLTISFNIEYKISVIETNNATYINYSIPINKLQFNDTIVYKEKDMYRIDTYLESDICNHKLTTTTKQIPYSSYVGKNIITLPFYIPYQLVSRLCYSISIIIIIICFFKLYQLNYLPNIKNIVSPLSKTNIKEHSSLHS